jgi:NitT/TauT family transport system ATP-binding protein
MSAASAAIEFIEVAKSYRRAAPRGADKNFRALAPISFRIEPGEFFSVIGPSGCGKSTLLNLLAGLDAPDSGVVRVDGQTVTKPGPDRAVVFQEAGLFPWMTVWRNVAYGLKLQGVSVSEQRERALEYLRLVHLTKFADALPHQLSGGMKQRVAIARALALRPRVLLMDEPFSALDAQTRDVLHEELQRIWGETGTTILFVTHNLREAVYLSDRILIMTASPGRIKRLVRVPFPHPRSKSSPELAEFIAALHDDIRDEVNRVAASDHDPDWQPLEVPAPGGRIVSGPGEAI